MAGRSDFKNIFISTFSRVSYQIFSMLVVFLLTPLMIKSLGDYKYGLWILVTIIVNYYGYTELGITSAIERNLAVAAGNNDKEEFNKIFNNGLFLNFIIFVLILIVTAISVLVLNHLKIKDYRLIAVLISVMGVNLALTFPFKSYQTIVSANIRFELISSVQLFQLILNSVLTAVFLLNGYKMVALAFIVLFSCLSANCLYIYHGHKLIDYLKYDFKLINKATIKNLLSYSGKTFFIQMAELLRFKLDEVVTATFISVNAVTFYSIANRLNASANNISMSFLGVLTPFFSKKFTTINNDEKIKLFFMASKIVITTASFVFFGFLILGSSFIKAWMGPSYSSAYYPLIVLGFGYFVAFSQSVGVNLMFSTNTHQNFGIMSAVEGILNLALSISFVVFFKLGITGVALGTLCSILATKTFFQPLLVSRLLELKLTKYYLFFVKNLSVGIILYAVAGLILYKFNPANYISIGISCLLLAVFALIHLILIMSKDEKKLVLGKINSKLNFVKEENALNDN